MGSAFPPAPYIGGGIWYAGSTLEILAGGGDMRLMAEQIQLGSGDGDSSDRFLLCKATNVLYVADGGTHS